MLCYALCPCDPYYVIPSAVRGVERYTILETRINFGCCPVSSPAQSFLVTVSAVNAVENFVEFKVFVVHREGWAFYQAVNAAKIEYYAAIKRLREDLGLSFARSAQPVILQQQQEGSSGGDSGEGRATRAGSVEERGAQEAFATGVDHRSAGHRVSFRANSVGSVGSVGSAAGEVGYTDAIPPTDQKKVR
jgi:hypothetical protein